MKISIKITIILLISMTALMTHAAKNKVSIVPEVFLRGYDPITVFLDTSQGPAAGGPLDIPGDLFKIDPAHPGEYKWLDAKTMQFLPAVAWPPLKEFSITSNGEGIRLSTMMIPPKRITPGHGSTGLNPVQKISLKFGVPLAVRDLAKMIRFEVKPLPGIGSDDALWLESNDFVIKAVERRSVSDDTEYIITFNKPIDYGKHVTLHFTLSLDTALKGALARYTFATKQEFRFSAMGCSYVSYPVASNGSIYSEDQAINCGTARTPLFLEFSESLGKIGIEDVKNLVSFEPSVNNLTYSVSGRRIYLNFTTEKETPYKITIEHYPVMSSTNRPLSYFGTSAFYFYYKQLEPFIKWRQGEAIVERYGPQFFPMEGRAMDKIDIRVYKIDPLSPTYWPYPRKPVVVDEDRRPKMPGEEPVEGRDMVEHIKLLDSPPVSDVIELPIDKNTGLATFGLDLRPYFEKISGKGQSGTYLVGYRVLGASSSRHYVRVSVTDLCLTTVEEENAVKFVVTSLHTGKPITGAEVTLETYGNYNDRKPEERFIRGATDDNGHYRYQHTRRLYSSLKRIIIKKGDDMLILSPDDPPPVFRSDHWYSSGRQWLGWLFNEPVNKKDDARIKGYVTTERPIYKPDEPVHIVGYVRTRKQGKILKPTDSNRRMLIITGPGRKEWKYPVELRGNGQFYLKFDEKELPTGTYSVSLRDETKYVTMDTASFKKENYRVPRFEITISGPDRVPVDKPFNLVLSADYYAGGRVVGQDVTWKITQYNYSFNLPDFPDFIFANDERFSGVSYDRSTGSIYKQDVTDENGSAKFMLNPALERDGKPLKYVVEATVRGADSQTVTTVKSVVALPPFTLGLKVDKFIKDALVIKPEVLVIGHNEKPLAGKSFSVRVYQRQWHSYLAESDFTTGDARYVTDVVDTQIYEQIYESTTEPMHLEIPVDQSGVYVVELLAKDNLGRLQKVRSDLYIAGDAPIAWKKTYANIFDAVPDKKSYVPGDTADILLKSPFQQAQALVVVEGPVENKYQWVEIKNGQGIVTVPVQDDMVPGFPVHTILMRGRLEGTGKQYTGKIDRGKPVAMANTTWIKVDPHTNMVKVALEHEERSLPGTTVKITIRLSDPEGRKLNGEVALWLVDRAVLALGQEKKIDALPYFIDPALSYLRFRETRNDVVGNLPVEEVSGGGGDYSEKKLLDMATVRKNFKTVPYFNSFIEVRNGEAEIEIELPDNLTDFAVRALATSGYDRFGFAKSVVRVRLPVIIQSALPRFVRPGDRFIAGGIGRIVEGEAGPGSAQIEVEGLKFNLAGSKDSYTRPIDWQFGKPEKLYFPMLVPSDLMYGGDNEVVVRMAVERISDKAMDAFEVRLPVAKDREVRYLDLFKEIDKDTPVRFPEPDEKYRAGTVEQTVVVTKEPALLKMAAGMHLLANYAHGCTEQRIAKLYPAVIYEEFLTKAGLERQTTINRQVFDDFFAFLTSVRKPNGLYGYWPGSQGYVSLTAHVVEFLSRCKAAGIRFDEDELLIKPTKTLKEALRSDYPGLLSGYRLTERIEALYALYWTGYFDESYANDFIYDAMTSNLYNKAKIVAVMLKKGYGNHGRVKEMISDIWSHGLFRLKDNKEVFEGLNDNYRYRSDLILSSEIKTLAMVIQALYLADPESPRIRMMVDELIRLGGSDGWGSTNANVAAMQALIEVIDVEQKRKDKDRFVIRFGSVREEFGLDEKIAYTYTKKIDTTGELAYDKAKEYGKHAWLKTTFVPSAPADQVTRRNEGFVVDTRLLTVDERNTIVDRIEVTAGSSITFAMDTIVEVETTVINAEDRKFVAVRVPFAAGFEPLNPELATSPKEAKPEGRITRTPSYSLYGDDSVTFYYDSLPKGTYKFYFRLRAGFEGNFVQPPARAEMMYNQAKRGRSDGTRIIIEGKK